MCTLTSIEEETRITPFDCSSISISLGTQQAADGFSPEDVEVSLYKLFSPQTVISNFLHTDEHLFGLKQSSHCQLYHMSRRTDPSSYDSELCCKTCRSACSFSPMCSGPLLTFNNVALDDCVDSLTTACVRKVKWKVKEKTLCFRGGRLTFYASLFFLLRKKMFLFLLMFNV